jgi:hypothetical protein
MRFIECDCCGRRDEERQDFHGFSYLCHLDQSQRPGEYVKGIDGELVPFSGRYEEKDLCLKCYNQVVLAAVLKFEELKEENGEL